MTSRTRVTNFFTFYHVAFIYPSSRKITLCLFTTHVLKQGSSQNKQGALGLSQRQCPIPVLFNSFIEIYLIHTPHNSPSQYQRPHFIVLCFTVLYQTSHFLQMEGCGKPVWSKTKATIFKQYLLTLCLCVTFW